MFSNHFQKIPTRFNRLRPPGRSGSGGKNPARTCPSTPAGQISRHAGLLNRRGFLGMLAAAAALLLPGPRAKAAVTASTKAIPLCRCFIAGFQFHQGAAVLSTLAAGQPLSLQREPANPHDELAIAVHTSSGIKIGYLPQRLNEIPAALMDSNQPLQAVIAGVSPKAQPWEKVELEIRLDLSCGN